MPEALLAGWQGLERVASGPGQAAHAGSPKVKHSFAFRVSSDAPKWGERRR